VPRGSLFDGELVALRSRDGRTVQDFAAVCRATLQDDRAATRRRHLVVFDLLELGGEDIRSLAWLRRTDLLREAFPADDWLRLVQTQPASRTTHDQLVALGFEGPVLKRPESTYRPGRQTTWRKYNASHRATARLRTVRLGRDGHTHALCDLDGQHVLGSPRLAALIGQRVQLAYCPIDAARGQDQPGSTSRTPRSPHRTRPHARLVHVRDGRAIGCPKVNAVGAVETRTPTLKANVPI
jgi:hypothetical protein